MCIRSSVQILVLSLLAGCALLDPAGTALKQAQALYEQGHAVAAVEAYERLLLQHADTDAAKTAGIEVHSARLALADQSPPRLALRLTRGVMDEGTGSAKALAQQQLPGRYKTLLDGHLAEKHYWEAGQLVAEARVLPDVDAVLQRAVGELSKEPQYSLSVEWASSSGYEAADRAQLALDIKKLGGAAAAATEPYLKENAATALSPKCLIDVQGLSSLDELAAVKAACEIVIAYGLGEQVREATATLESIPKREQAIKRSPSYRTEAALQICRQFQSWIRRQRRAGNITALQNGVQGERGRRFQDAIEYLQERMYSLSSMDAQYRFANRVKGACGG